MKLLHISDLHLGKSIYDFDLIEDQKYILNQMLDVVDKESIDAVLIAGDVYDKSIPSEAATRLLDWFLCQLASKKVKTFMISGNHDSDDRLNFGSALFEANQIYISAIYDGKLKKYSVSDGDTDINIYLLPFVKASQVKHYYPDAKIENYEDAVRVILENTDLDESKNNILVAHQFVTGNGSDPSLAGSEGAGVQCVGTVEKIACRLFDKFDYVALGHIHSPQKVGREEIRYCGSPLKYSLSEAHNEKSVPIITIDKKNVTVDLLPLTPKRNMRHLKGKMKELLNAANVTDTEDFIYVTLTDEDIINNVMGIFQQTYPNTVKIDYENSHTREIEHVDITTITQNKPFEEVISEFYRLMYSDEISEEEMKVMKDVARKAGVISETD